eukprot:TRINITY_DN3855_c0_g1_i3.p1 TRINITY_DN3855_c0_g1~~TRINITY_DN3855_c0_g1_i3.p1  ORF type:complete len:262 (-),score=32.92 TRINITY_DN3855_c0_g1_i3:358-1143(-)
MNTFQRNTFSKRLRPAPGLVEDLEDLCEKPDVQNVPSTQEKHLETSLRQDHARTGLSTRVDGQPLCLEGCDRSDTQSHFFSSESLVQDVGATNALERACDKLRNTLSKHGILPNTVEQFVFAYRASQVDMKQFRSIIWNIGRNTKLRDDVNSGVISFASLLNMSGEDLACEKVKKRRCEWMAASTKEVILKDLNSFRTKCVECGDEDARALMVNLGGCTDVSCGGCCEACSGSGGRRNLYGRLVKRAVCEACGHIWVEGRE